MIKLKKEKSYNIQIWVGLKEGYDGPTHIIDEVYSLCYKYVNENKTCVTVTPTRFFYVNGFEDGVIIGLINYPRFPNTKRHIRKNAIKIAKLLMEELKQYRVTVTTPTKSYLIENLKIK